MDDLPKYERITLRTTRANTQVANTDHLEECDASRGTHAAAWRRGTLDTGDVQPGRSRTAFTCRETAGETPSGAVHEASDCAAPLRHAWGYGAAEVHSLPLRRGLKQTSAARRLPTA